MNINLGKVKFDEEQDICMISKGFLIDLLITKGKMAATQWRNWAKP